MLNERLSVIDPCNPYKRAIAKLRREIGKKRTSEALCYYASLLHLDDQFEEAMTWLNRCLHQYPSDPTALYLQSLLLLSEGDYKRGFELYENRFKRHGWTWNANAMSAPWDGAPTQAKVFCWQEGGFGDVLQMVRYMPEVWRRAPNALLSVKPTLIPLLRQSGFRGEIIRTLSEEEARSKSVKPIIPDFSCSLMSVPHLLGVELVHVKGAAYLHAGLPAVEKWRKELAGRPKIGICWRGNPQHERDLTRSISGDLVHEVLGREFDLLSLMPEHTKVADWADTAGLLANLKLVISVDTSIAHLAGAMGVPCWIMLPVDFDWRWMRHRTDSPWYDSVRLYRQPSHGAWRSVLERIAKDLRAEQ
jgi:tetratricopeptide (TPR) repeat protein